MAFPATKVLFNQRIGKMQDDTLTPFLDFLAKDIEQRSQQLKPFTNDVAARLRKLTEGVSFDLHSPEQEDDSEE
jgi:prlF antitoxin for toxin YhaV_toxin